MVFVKKGFSELTKIAVVVVFTGAPGVAIADCPSLWFDDDYWAGSYEVKAGPQFIRHAGGSRTNPGQAQGTAVVTQTATSLIVVHSLGILSTELDTITFDVAPWNWGTTISVNQITLEDAEIVAGCANNEMPRWKGFAVSSGPPVAVELVAITETHIMGRLSVNHGGVSMNRMLLLTRGEAPVSN